MHCGITRLLHSVSKPCSTWNSFDVEFDVEQALFDMGVVIIGE